MKSPRCRLFELKKTITCSTDVLLDKIMGKGKISQTTSRLRQSTQVCIPTQQKTPLNL
jgi:hypothetical protein